MDAQARIDEFIERLQAASWKDRDAIKEELLAFCREHADDALVRHLEGARKGLNDLELRWEIDEVLESLQPEPEPEEPDEEEEEPEDDAPDDGRLRMSDLSEVYADPRGLSLFVDKKTQTRWFAMQPDPYTGQPAMMEVPPGQVEQIKAQLKGSPYWRLGSGVAPA